MAGSPKLGEKQFFRIAKALSDPKRFEMLAQISACNEPPTCTEICEASGLSKATVSHHLSELADAGLIQFRRTARFAYLEPDRETLTAYLDETTRRLKIRGQT